MHDGMPYGRNQGQRQGHSREVDHQSPTGLIFVIVVCKSFDPHLLSNVSHLSFANHKCHHPGGLFSEAASSQHYVSVTITKPTFFVSHLRFAYFQFQFALNNV